MLKLSWIYTLLGLFVLYAALLNLRERRWSMATFWAILACPFLFGDLILAASSAGTRWPAQAMGVGVLGLGVMAARGGLGMASDDAAAQAARRTWAQRLGNRLFVPALAIPLVTLLLVLAGPYLRWGGVPLIEDRQSTLTALGLACVIAFGAALRVTRVPVATGLGEGRRLLDALGWAALLPMLLATLGSVFATTGVGDAITALVGALIPTQSALACLIAFALGMVLFTVIMGNAFAAFPVLMAGVGLPLLVQQHGAAPAILGSIGMLTGYCGTLLTPMAANFNIVPAVLLELPDQYGVIRVQWPTALALLVVNFLLMWWLVF
ncbi:MAG: DUF979 domain-containing protein [Xanthomonadales bacterium]|nr:DUF979 domain-containing protein [Xanthomonadales bacterium]MCC6595475.1 DUF979 domain-containing protein [Rhodanobacteraceae bacterium]MCW5577378.1 DUF979 domain-containing protein [Dokdonella sp.]MDL1868462.1 DUF979 domain-containing protein [Gammaproteobacteria bacterium PRO6]